VTKTVAVQATLDDPAELGSCLIPKALAGLDAKVLDIIVNNAFVSDLTTWETFETISLDGFSKMMNGNVFGMISVVQAAMPHFPPQGGRVINISSVASKIGNDNPSIVYGASKAAIDSITRSLAVTYAAKTGATFNSVSVGATLTDGIKTYIETAGQQALDRHVESITAEKRIGLPEDVAFAVGFLASEEGRWLNGANIAANGGMKELIALQG
jgi:3-oxoacyl-[acyl-carrier protein] reductase